MVNLQNHWSSSPCPDPLRDNLLSVQGGMACSFDIFQQQVNTLPQNQYLMTVFRVMVLKCIEESEPILAGIQVADGLVAILETVTFAEMQQGDGKSVLGREERMSNPYRHYSLQRLQSRIAGKSTSVLPHFSLLRPKYFQEIP